MKRHARHRTKNRERPMWFLYVVKDNGNTTKPEYVTGNDLGNALQRLAVGLPDKVSELRVWQASDDPIRTATIHQIGKAKPKRKRQRAP